MGSGANAGGDDAVAIGTGAQATDGAAVAIGLGNVASGDGAVAIGDPNHAIGRGAVAIGADNSATGLAAVAIGADSVPSFPSSSSTMPAYCAGSVATATRAKFRSEEHTSELQSLMRISYAVFCLKKKNQQ